MTGCVLQKDGGMTCAESMELKKVEIIKTIARSTLHLAMDISQLQDILNRHNKSSRAGRGGSKVEKPTKRKRDEYDDGDSDDDYAQFLASKKTEKSAAAYDGTDDDDDYDDDDDIDDAPAPPKRKAGKGIAGAEPVSPARLAQQQAFINHPKVKGNQEKMTAAWAVYNKWKSAPNRADAVAAYKALSARNLRIPNILKAALGH
jgi:hypothetical protein